jgi:PBSX family phage portal protein
MTQEQSTHKRANDANQTALRNARVVALIDVSKRRGVSLENVDIEKRTATTDGTPGKTTTINDDPLGTMTERGDIIESPFDMLSLAMLPEYSSELGQCVESYQVNIEGNGHRQVPRVHVKNKDAPPELVQAVNKEHARLANFFEYCTSESFVEFRKKLRKDLETTGNYYYEVIRDTAGAIQQFQHVPSYQVRLSRQDDGLTEVERPILKLQEDGSVTIEKVKEWRRFRRYVQCRSIQRRNLQMTSNKLRWFKSFGDKRAFDNVTGEPAKADTPPERLANEMIHVSIYAARSPYGLPRYIGNLLSIYGDRAAEEINFTTFRNNNIPSMVICVSNGQLTEGSLQRIETFVEAQIQGSDNYSKFVLLEGESTSEDGEDGGQVKIDIKPLTSEQHKDALFQNYSGNNQDKIRRAFRLPPILVGKSEGVTRATAEASIMLADKQVFAPERDSFDAVMNRMIYPDMGVCYHKYKSNSPVTTDELTLVQLMSGAEKTGGMTPRIARAILAAILNEDIQDDFPDGFDPDKPFSLQMAEAVKNQADAAEPGQQVTALKVLKSLGIDVDAYGQGKDAFAAFMVDVNKALEGDWRHEASKAEHHVEQAEEG